MDFCKSLTSSIVVLPAQLNRKSNKDGDFEKLKPTLVHITHYCHYNDYHYNSTPFWFTSDGFFLSKFDKVIQPGRDRKNWINEKYEERSIKEEIKNGWSKSLQDFINIYFDRDNYPPKMYHYENDVAKIKCYPTVRSREDFEK